MTLLQVCRRAAPAILALLAAAIAPADLRAQYPQPRIARLTPPGSARGKTADVTIQGDHLEELRALRFSSPGMVSRRKSDAVFEVEISPQTPPGVYSCWVVGRWGASYPVSFCVDDLAEVRETEPNNAIANAAALALESVVNGVIEPALDVDCFKVSLKSGQRVFFDVVAQRIESNLDSTLTLFNPAGKKLAYNRDFRGEDSFIDFTAPADGDFYIQLNDFLYQGGGDHFYRLRVTAQPSVDFTLPLAVPAGMAASLQVFGRGLAAAAAGGAAPAQAGSHWLDGRPLESIPATVQAPADPSGLLLSRYGGDLYPQVAKVDLFDFQLQSALGASPAVPIGIAQGDVVLETEPNDGPEQAQSVSIPCDISAQFIRKNDLDWFTFEAKKDEPLWIEVVAARMGSACDAVVTLTRADAGSSFIIEVDEDGEMVQEKRFDTRGPDPAFRWQAPDNGKFRVQVRDHAASGRAGLGLFYRLIIRRERPDFRIYLLANRPDAPGALTLYRDSCDYYEVFCLRRGGYGGMVRIEATGLPIGVTCQPAILGPQCSMAPLIFQAERGAVIAATSIGIAATGWNEGERTDRTASWIVMDSASKDGDTPNLVRRVGSLPLAVVEDEAPFTVSASPGALALRKGDKAPVKVSVRRNPPFDREVAISAVASIPGLKIPQVKIAKEKTEETIEFFLEQNPIPGRYTMTLVGEAAVPFAKKAGEKLQDIKARFASPPIIVDVIVPPFDARIADAHGGKINPGGALAIDVALQRKFNFNGPVALTLVVPDAFKEVQAPEVVIPFNQSAGTLNLKATDKAAPAPASELVIKASADFLGTQVVVEMRVTLQVAPKQ